MNAESQHHLVLARKWRPERFQELVGQEQVTRTLTQALTSGRIAHAFLFAGIRGVGKTTAARILARCLNCERGPTPEPCGECVACEEVRQGRALDVVEIDGATYRKIDDARVIIENLSYRPARDRFKIYIIDEAHQLTDQAFNALLKTLEEPPPHIKFILATTEPQKMPDTILSRLQRYDFRRIPFAIIRGRLGELARLEAVTVEPGALTLLAREAGGSMRDAERMLETAIALGGGNVTEAQVAEILGVAGRSRLYGLAEAILRKDAAAALATVRDLHRSGTNLEALGRDLLETLRNLAVAKLPSGGADSPLDDLPDHEAAEITRLAAQSSLRDLMRLFRLMAQAQEEILRSPYTDLMLEMAVVRMATLAPVVEAEELLRAIGAAEKDLKSPPGTEPSSDQSERPGVGDDQGTGARKIKVAGEVKAAAPLRSDTQDTPSSDRRDLPELRDFIRQRRAALAGFMEQGAGLELSDDALTLTAKSDVYLRYLADNRATIAALASELYGRTIAVTVRGAAAGDSATITAMAAPPADTKPNSPSAGTAANGGREPDSSQRDHTREALYTDPVVRRVFDELGGRLVDVRERASGRTPEIKAKPAAGR